MTRSHRTSCSAAAAWPLVGPAWRWRSDPVAVGKYLVDTSGCHDCHTPWIMGPNGRSRT